MVFSKITGMQAFAHMHQWMLQHKNIEIGRCHATCQNAWGLPVKYMSAIDAWNHVPKAHRHTDMSKCPIGSPVFFSGGLYGHVAMQSDRVGVLISTDAPSAGYIGEVRTEYFTQKWGKELLGWASQYNDIDLQLGKMPTKA
jgi:hypothetical protein